VIELKTIEEEIKNVVVEDSLTLPDIVPLPVEASVQIVTNVPPMAPRKSARVKKQTKFYVSA